MMRTIGSLFTLLFVCGCSGAYRQQVDFNPAEPLRVVVVPFVFVEKDGSLTEGRGDLLIDNVAGISEKVDAAPAVLMRRLVVGELKQTGLDVIAPGFIDSELIHHGFATPDLKVDRARVFSAKPGDICQHYIVCDAVLYGRITKWNRDYLAIESRQEIEFDLKLVSVREGKTLFSASARDSDSRGITKGPTGFSDLVIEPIRGLDSEIVTDLAREMVGKSLAGLKVENRPDYLKRPPPAIFAAGYDAYDSNISTKGSLTVVASGTPKRSAWFVVGGAEVPMFEVSGGNYVGEFFPLLGDSFEKSQVTVHLSDEFGRETLQEIGGPGVTLK